MNLTTTLNLSSRTLNIRLSEKPNSFPKAIYDNISFGAKINGYKGSMDELVETSLRKAALWDEVKDQLKKSGLALSGRQQQRLCIARAIGHYSHQEN